MDERSALLRAAGSDPTWFAGLVLSDWLADRGELSAAAAFRAGPVVAFPKTVSVTNFLGRGRGSGIGSGIGIGSGRGSGSGIGIGSGRGRGSGSGSGIGSGSGSGRGIIGAAKMVEGKNYLIHAGDWHTFVGRCKALAGPLLYELEQVSKIRDTNNGDNWHVIAAGDAAARKAVDYVHYKGTAFIPLSIIAFEWAGELPWKKP